MKFSKTISFAFFGVILSVFFAACGDSNSASTDQHEHFEVEGWNLYWPDYTLAYSVFRGKVDSEHKELRVNANCLSEHINIKFLNDEEKEIFEKFSECSTEMHDLTEREAFVKGFTIGARIIIEVLATGSDE